MPLIKLDGRSIQFSDSIKYLGITQNMAIYYLPSILPVLSKIFEMLLNKQIIEYFQINGLFSDNKCGFIPKRSTSSAIN